MFDFNDSTNDVAPVSPILFPVYEKRKEKSELLMDVFCVSFVFTAQIELSECFVCFQCFTKITSSCASNLVPCWFKKNEE